MKNKTSSSAVRFFPDSFFMASVTTWEHPAPNACDSLTRANRLRAVISWVIDISGFLIFLVMALCCVPYIFCSGRLANYSRKARRFLQTKLEKFQQDTQSANEEERVRRESEAEQPEESEGCLKKRLKLIGQILLLVVAIVLTSIAIFLSHFIKFAFDVYLVVSSLGGIAFGPEWIANRLSALSNKLARVFEITIPGLGFLADAWDFVEWISRRFSAIFAEATAGMGVTCGGAQSPVYLLGNYVIIAIVVIMFDSNFYVFLKVMFDSMSCLTRGRDPLACCSRSPLKTTSTTRKGKQ